MAQEGTQTKNIGLRGVKVADTAISTIDGSNGVLIYRGFRIEDLANGTSFLETVYLLMNDKLPNAVEYEQFRSEVNTSRPLPPYLLKSLRDWPREADPMDVLQASVPLLAMADPELRDESRGANVRKAIRLIARMPAVVAAWHRFRSGLDPIPPRQDLSHAANFLWQLTGSEPDEETSRALDICMILQAEHTFNASTFACREVVSTGAHMYAGVAAGVGALSGSLHGGANAKVVELLFKMEDQWKTEEDVTRWVRERLDRRERIMGMGHPVYKTHDPRAEIMKSISRSLARRTGFERRCQLLETIERSCEREFIRRGKKGIKANVDFYSGLLFSMMSIPVDIMTPVFAFSLLAGWCAHIIEEKFAEAQGKPALYRPEADYVGNYCGKMGCTFVPMSERQ